MGKCDLSCGGISGEQNLSLDRNLCSLDLWLCALCNSCLQGSQISDMVKSQCQQGYVLLRYICFLMQDTVSWWMGINQYFRVTYCLLLQCQNGGSRLHSRTP
jgi:hypothetical protein